MNGLLKGLNGSAGAWIARAIIGALIALMFSSTQGWFSKLLATLESHGERLEAVDRKTDAVKERVDAADADSKFRFGLTTEHLNKIDGKVDKLDDRLRNVETKR